MNNLPFSEPPHDECLDNVKKGTRDRKHNFIETNSASLIAAHDQYDEYARNGRLNGLSSAYIKPGPKKRHNASDYWIAYDLYGSSLKCVASHWEELIRLNGGRTLICPICGLSDCREMDHFAPRSKFPEHSCHISNLIPVCHNCNNDKGDGWLNHAGEQKFFNAFFDTNIPESIIKCDIKRIGRGQLVRAKISFSDSLDMSIPEHKRVKETVVALRLMDRFQDEASKIIRRESKRLKIRYEETSDKFDNPDEFYSSYLNELEKYLDDDIDFIENEVLNSIMTSPEFKSYFQNIIISP